MNGKSNVKLPKYADQYWHENKEQVLENWMNLLTDDVRLESLADGALDIEFTRLYHCTNDVLGYFEGLSTDWDMIVYKVDNDLSEGDRLSLAGNTVGDSGDLAGKCKHRQWMLSLSKIRK